MFGCSYIYSEVVSVSVDTAPSLVYAAKKYMLSKLVRECGVCLSDGLNVRNVIQVLETSFIIEDKELESTCLQLIVQKLITVFTGTEILAASLQAMEVILRMDSIPLKEIVIYKTCIAWAKHQLQFNNSTENQPTDRQIREILGDLLYMIRFPVMEVSEFVEISEGRTILTPEEKTSIFYFLTAKKKGSQLTFSTEPRRFTEEAWIERTVTCAQYCTGWVWSASLGADIVDFKTDQDILLTGVGLYTGHDVGGYQVDIEILQSAESLFMKKLTVPSTGDGNQFKVSVDDPIFIKAGVLYSVKALSSGNIVHFGRTCQAVCTQGKVTFSFLYNSRSFHTTHISGQIPRLYFRF